MPSRFASLMMHSMVFRLLFGFVLPLFLQSSSVLSNPLVLGLQSTSSGLPNPSGLRVGFYRYTCPNAEAIVRDEMTKIISQVPSLAGPLLRMHFHDCFVNVSVIILVCSEFFQLCSKGTWLNDWMCYAAGLWWFCSSEQPRGNTIREGGDTEPQPARLWHDRPCQGEAGAGLPWSGVLCWYPGFGSKGCRCIGKNIYIVCWSLFVSSFL